MSSSLSLARFAFNIYGNLQGDVPPSPGIPRRESPSERPQKLLYNCDREVACVAQLSTTISASGANQHIVLGGKNYLRLLTLTPDQGTITGDVNLLQEHTPVSAYGQARHRLHNVNTISTHGSTVACGLQSGLVTIYSVNGAGKSRLTHKLADHKRCINSLDFVGAQGPADTPQQLLTGSQDGTMKLWDLRAGLGSSGAVLTVQSPLHSDPIRACQYSRHLLVRNRLCVLSVHDSGSLCKYDLRLGFSGGNVSFPERKWTFHTGPALSLNIHPDREYVLTGGRDKKLCVWNYGDYSHKVAPDHVINTYGPVMKVRWSPYGPENHSDAWDQHLGDTERDMGHQNPLFAYDLACLYLNEDPTLSVYNLKRKHIPKEIITTTLHKPFQNFVWARNPAGSRTLWTVTKSNVFVSYDLSRANLELLPNIMRPLDNLALVAVTWAPGAASDLALVNQEKDEFVPILDDSLDLYSPEQEAGFGLPDSVGPVSTDDDADASRGLVGLVPVASNFPHTHLATLLTLLPVEKPVLYRSNTHSVSTSGIMSTLATFGSVGAFPGSGFGTLAAFQSALHSGNGPHSSVGATKLPLPVPPPRPHLPEHKLLRPALPRNPSQSTQGLGLSLSLLPNQPVAIPRAPVAPKKTLAVNHALPYVVPVSVSLPLSDHQVFRLLAENYQVSLPDGFSLMDICYLNASAAAAVGRHRDCQTWRTLAVSLEQTSITNFRPVFGEEVADKQVQNDSHSEKSLSEGHIVGSFNSNSTLTTNYGGGLAAGGASSAGSGMASAMGSILASLPLRAPFSTINASATSLMDSIANRRNSMSPGVSRSNSMLFGSVGGDTGDAKEIESKISQGEDRKDTKKATKGTKMAENDPPEIVKDESATYGPLATPRLQGPSKINTALVSPLEKAQPSPHRARPENITFEKGPSSPIGAIGRRRSLAESPRHSVGRFHPVRQQRPSVGAPMGSEDHIFAETAGEDLDNENLHYLSSSVGFNGDDPRLLVHSDHLGLLGGPNPTNGDGVPLLGTAGTNDGLFSSSAVSGAHNSSSWGYFGPQHSSLVPSHGQHVPGRSHGSMLSRRNSSIVPTYGFQGSNRSSFQMSRTQSRGLSAPSKEALIGASNLLRLDESGEEWPVDSANSATRSGLTRVMNGRATEMGDAENDRPWATGRLLQKALEYATLQGDIVLAATLTVLFYPYYGEDATAGSHKSSAILLQASSLECVALYVDILRRKQLFVIAANVVKMAPAGLHAQLSLLSNKEVELRFFCAWCKKLLVNEDSKQRLAEAGSSDSFGYWYCDACAKKQPNCVYCNEPCKGLNVVVGLKCGHRGHFGCLKEWFVEGTNGECPGGCLED